MEIVAVKAGTINLLVVWIVSLCVLIISKKTLFFGDAKFVVGKQARILKKASFKSFILESQELFYKKWNVV